MFRILDSEVLCLRGGMILSRWGGLYGTPASVGRSNKNWYSGAEGGGFSSVSDSSYPTIRGESSNIDARAID